MSLGRRSSDPTAITRVTSAPIGATPADAGAVGKIGRYLVIEELGRGGMGTVLRAYDPKLQREIALKTVHADELSVGARSVLLHEAQAMAKLSHPNVVSIFDVETLDGEVVIAMEYVRGATLKEWLLERRPWTEIVAAFEAAGQGLAAAHRVGILHRDFKPANVLVGDDGRVRVADFGLARAHSPVTDELLPSASVEHELASGEAAGTPRYMAPEQWGGEPLGPAVDQYAFCLALWESLVGETPFPSKSSKFLGPPAWPRGSVEVPGPLREALARGLSVQPGERWASMEDLLAVLAARPRVRARRLLAGAVACTVPLAGTVWAAHAQRSERCTGASDQLAQVWNDEHREAVRRGLAATQVRYADGVWRRVAPRLDDYAAAWVAMHTDACAATTIRGEQAAAVMDRRMACLHRAKVDLQAVTNLLTTADSQVVEKAHQIVDNLPPLHRCADVDALMAAVPPPNPEDAEAVEAIRGGLSEVRALHAAGKYPEALATARELAEQTEAVSYPPVQTEVAVELAAALERTLAFAEAESLLRGALRLALRSRQWETAHVAASHLVDVVGARQLRAGEGFAYAEVARGLLEHTGELHEAALLSNTGYVLTKLGKYTEAEAQQREALAILEGAGGTTAAQWSHRKRLAGILVEQGRYAETEQEQRTLLQHQQEVLGSDHPDIADLRFELVHTLYRLGRYVEAETEARLALELWTRTLGSDHLHVAMARGSLANVLNALNRPQEAEAEARAHLHALRDAFGPDSERVSVAHGSLGMTLVKLGRFAEAEAQLLRATAIDEKILGAEHPETGRTRALLTSVLIAQERYAEGEAQARLVLAAYGNAKGYEHPGVPSAHSHLAHTLRRQGRYAEAEAEFRAAVVAAERILGSEHGHVGGYRASVGDVLADQGRYAEAETELRAALEVQRAALEPEPVEIGTTLGSLGYALAAQGRFGDAEAAYREGIALYDDADMAALPSFALLEAGLGRVLIGSGKTREAQRVLESAWATWENDTRVAAPMRRQIALDLARTLRNVSGARERARALDRAARDL